VFPLIFLNDLGRFTVPPQLCGAHATDRSFFDPQFRELRDRAPLAKNSFKKLKTRPVELKKNYRES
jgi:hypothetical protein